MAGTAAVPNCGADETGVAVAVAAADPKPPNVGVDAACPNRPEPVAAGADAEPNRPVAGAELPNTDDAVVAAGEPNVAADPKVKFDDALVVAVPNPNAGAVCAGAPNALLPPNSDDAVVVTGCWPNAGAPVKLNPCPGLLLFPPNMLREARCESVCSQLDPDSCDPAFGHVSAAQVPAAALTWSTWKNRSGRPNSPRSTT